MITTIWERYFLKQFIKMFFLFLFCFYGLYVLIDYASHTCSFANHHIQIPWKEVARYYFFVFASRAEILLPLALLIAFVHTVCSLNNNQELVALMASGFKLKLLMRPFLAVGFIFFLLIYANEQLLLPQVLRKLRRIEEVTKHQKKHQSLNLAAQNLILEDGSLFIYQRYDTEKERFFDIFWIESIDSIYRMKYLSPFAIPKGLYVDHFVRQPAGELLQVASYQEIPFPNLHFKQEPLQPTILEPEIFSLFELAKQTFKLPKNLNEKESKILTAFYWKLMIPFLCLFAIIAPAPYCVKFSRNPPIFLIYVGTLFGFIAFYLFMDASQVIAKRQVFPPFWAIVAPFCLLFSYFGWHFYQMD